MVEELNQKLLGYQKKTMSLKSFDSYKLPGHSLSWMPEIITLKIRRFNVIWN